jgi:uncharacterized protein
VLTSPALLDELDEKLRLKLRVSAPDADIIRSRLQKSAQLVMPGISLAVIKDDPDDDHVLECAIAGKADFVVSGDRHLLKLGPYEGIPIVSVRQFMDTIDADF